MTATGEDATTGLSLVPEVDAAAETAGLDAEELAQLEKETKAREKAERAALDRDFGAHGFIVMPSEAPAPILSKPLRTVLHQWLFEMSAQKELKAAGLLPRTTAMLQGPPGCGKTTLAHHIAARLGVPMVVIQAHSLTSMYIGETGRNVGKLFRAARKSATGVALFFDEFDAMAKTRTGKGRSGAEDEKASITISLMQELDRYEGLLFAATNEPESIDKAVWRRFQMQIEIGLPGEDEREAIVRLYMSPFAVEPEVIAFLADMFEGASPALIKECCETLRRGLVLNPRMNHGIALPALLRGLVDVVSPADLENPPKLWTRTSQYIGQAMSLAWPPTMKG